MTLCVLLSTWVLLQYKIDHLHMILQYLKNKYLILLFFVNSIIVVRNFNTNNMLIREKHRGMARPCGNILKIYEYMCTLIVQCTLLSLI